MKIIRVFTAALALMLVIPLSVSCQSTYTKVYQILQTNCLSTGCHEGNDATFNLNLSEADLYNALVRVTPVNTVAAGRGDKLINPGDQHYSFLVRKINNGLDADNDIKAGEGDPMPSATTHLSNYEIELINQWVLFGAPQTGNVVDTSVIKTYYTVGGINSVPSPLTPPASNEGFQVHVGKIFLAPKAETEIFLKLNPRISSNTEVNRVTSLKSPQLHHFIIYKFYNGMDASYPDGWRDTSRRSHGDADMFTALFPQIPDHVLPNGTAYLIPKNTIFDIDCHVKNYSNDSVLAVEAYFNVYTQPMGTATDYMYSRFFINDNIVIPPGDTTVFPIVAQDTSEKRMWNIWILYTHTHKYGKDFDVWKQNWDGTQGAQVYEGFYDLTYTFNQGFYGTDVESPQRHFESPYLQIDPRLGLISRAKWYNYGTDTVRWGLTLNDEMMAMGFQFTYGDSLGALPTGIKSTPSDESKFRFFPNPASESFTVNFTLQQPANVILELTSTLGETVRIMDEHNLSAGNYLQEVKLGKLVPAGVYALTFRSGGSVTTKRIIIQ